jgi:hypothetical protein
MARLIPATGGLHAASAAPAALADGHMCDRMAAALWENRDKPGRGRSPAAWPDVPPPRTAAAATARSFERRAAHDAASTAVATGRTSDIHKERA